MDRREFNVTLAAASLINLIAPAALAQPAPPSRPRVGFLIYPDMIMLDLVGPLTVFSIMQADIHLIAKTAQPVTTDVRLPVAPTASFETALLAQPSTVDKVRELCEPVDGKWDCAARFGLADSEIAAVAAKVADLGCAELTRTGLPEHTINEISESVQGLLCAGRE